MKSAWYAFVLSVLTGACASDADPMEAGYCAMADNPKGCLHSGDTISVGFSDADFSEAEVRQACAYLWDVGLYCSRVPPAEANVRLVISGNACWSGVPNTAKTVARSYAGGTTVFYRDCFTSGISAQARIVTLAHELGHQAGMEHVPPDCNTQEGRNHVNPATGQCVCGHALMNAVLDTTLTTTTSADLGAFAMRHAAFYTVSNATTEGAPTELRSE